MKSRYEIVSNWHQVLHIAETIGCLHVSKASHSSKKWVGVWSVSPHRILVTKCRLLRCTLVCMFLYEAILNTVVALSGRSPAMAVRALLGRLLCQAFLDIEGR